MLIFERDSVQVGESSPPYSLIPFLLFFRSFRSPSFYEEHLRGMGFHEIRCRGIPLEMPFFLLTGKK